MRLLLFDTHFLLCVGKKDWFSVLVGHPRTAKQLRYTLFKPYSHFQNLFTLGILEPTPECSRRINRMDFLALICGNGYQDDKQDDSDARVWFRMKLLIPEDWIQLYRITVDSARENRFFSLPCNLYPYVFATPDYRLEAFDRACQKNLYLKPSSPQHFLSQKYGNPEWAAWFLSKPSFNLDPAPAKRSSRWDPEYFLAGATSNEHPS